jgi:hypothetical protein
MLKGGQFRARVQASGPEPIRQPRVALADLAAAAVARSTGRAAGDGRRGYWRSQRLIRRTPGLRSVLSLIQKKTYLDPKERHRLEN